jgi:cob(I)alamin adenosyltransferase
MLTTIQNELFDIGSELASPGSQGGLGVPVTDSSQVTRLEQWIDQLNSTLPTLQSFVLPGGTLLNAHLHIARCVCRRAERTVLSLHDCEPVPAPVRHYLNRLSDLIFVMSRSASLIEGKKEILWVPGASRATAQR